MIEKLRDHKRAAALLRAAISLKERQCNSSESSLADKIDINKMCVFKFFERFRRRVRRFF